VWVDEVLDIDSLWGKRLILREKANEKGKGGSPRGSNVSADSKRKGGGMKTGRRLQAVGGKQKQRLILRPARRIIKTGRKRRAKFLLITAGEKI